MGFEGPRSPQIIEQQVLLNILIVVAREAVLASQLPPLKTGKPKNRRIYLLVILIHCTPPYDCGGG
jgi:hypothetical protein